MGLAVARITRIGFKFGRAFGRCSGRAGGLGGAGAGMALAGGLSAAVKEAVRGVMVSTGEMMRAQDSRAQSRNEPEADHTEGTREPRITANGCEGICGKAAPGVNRPFSAVIPS